MYDWLATTRGDADVRAHLKALVSRTLGTETDDNKLETIYIFLTRKCNLGCQHCYIEGVGPTARDADFDLETIRSLIEQALPHGLRKVKVSGGEPFVRRDAMEILQYLDSRGLEVVLETNGTLFRPDTVARLAELRRFTIFVSLDHLDEHEHDEFRGQKGSYAKTVEVLRRLGETDINSIVTTTANRHNYLVVPAIVEMVLGWGIKRHRTLMNIHPIGNARSHLDNAISMEEMAILVKSMMSSPDYQSGRAYMTMPPALMPLHMLEDVHTCGWGKHVLGLLSNGDVSMCSASYDDPEMIGGNAFKDNLIEIWKNSQFFQKLREIGAGQVKGVCGNCVFYAACRGVCRMSSYSHYGDIDAPYPLCQEAYENGNFPSYALVDPGKDAHYGAGAIKERRTSEPTDRLVPISALRSPRRPSPS